jgi:tRNA A37 methylthiotransferase MiaB
MGRGYTSGDYRELVRRLREARHDLALSTDVIVGFPGETDGDFQATLALIEELKFACVFAFKYSPRPGTAALRLGDQVDPGVADRRLQALLGMQTRIQLELNRELEGREMEVLVTARGRREGSRVGRSACHRLVHFDALVADDHDGSLEPGRLTRVRVERGLPHSLIASLIAGGGRRRGATASARETEAPFAGVDPGPSAIMDLDRAAAPIGGSAS